MKKPRSRQSLPRSRQPPKLKNPTGSHPRSRREVPRSRYYSKARRLLQGINRGRGRRCRGRAFVRREEKKSSRRNTAVAVKDAAVAPIIQDTHRGRGRSAAVAGEAVSKSPDFLPGIISFSTFHIFLGLDYFRILGYYFRLVSIIFWPETFVYLRPRSRISFIFQFTFRIYCIQHLEL